MKKTLIAILCAFPFALIAQQPFNIRGTIKNLKDGDKIRIIYSWDGKIVNDSAIVEKEHFNFNGLIVETVSAELYNNTDHASFFIEPGAIKVSSETSMGYSVFTGTKTNEDAEKLKAEIKPFANQFKAINDEYAKLTKEQQKDNSITKPMNERYAKASAEMLPVMLKFIQENPKSFISLSSLQVLAGNPEVKPKLETLFTTLSPEIKNTKAGNDLALLLGAGKKTAIGVLATNFTQNDTNGQPVNLSDFKGKYVLVDFWASWCAPCRAENPNVVSAYNKFKDKNFTVLGVSLDRADGKAAWLKAIADDKLVWTQVSDLKFWNNEVAKGWGVQSVPTNFLISPDGKIIAKDLRGEELHKKLNILLK